MVQVLVNQTHELGPTQSPEQQHPEQRVAQRVMKRSCHAQLMVSAKT
jgi:hypothetical protein